MTLKEEIGKGKEEMKRRAEEMVGDEMVRGARKDGERQEGVKWRIIIRSSADAACTRSLARSLADDLRRFAKLVGTRRRRCFSTTLGVFTRG